MSFGRISVLGGGAWGTALAVAAGRAGRRVSLWARDPATVAAIRERGENPRMPGLRLDPAPLALSDLPAATAADFLLLAVPAQQVRALATQLRLWLKEGVPVVVCAKGIERTSGRRMAEILAEALPQAVPAVLSGPSFAGDVARGLPTAVTVAAADGGLAASICEALGHAAFRPYAETDMVGVELGGALKNVLAIAAGIVVGRSLGNSAQAALVTRGFAELRRFAEAFGARPETLMGLSGLGDLVLTCSSARSRNFAYGVSIGESGGVVPPEVLVEGRDTAFIARDLAAGRSIDMPIVAAVADILEGRLTVDDAVAKLLARPLRREAD